MHLLHESTVLPEEIDSLGHMNVRFYMKRMEQANRAILAKLGIDEEEMLAGRFLRCTDTYTRFRSEQFEGATLHALGGLLESAEGGMRSYVEITNPDTEDVAATFIVTTALIDSATRHVVPLRMPEASAARVEIPGFARPRSLSLDAVNTEVSLEELDARIPSVEGGGMGSGRVESTIEQSDVDEAGWLREDVELMFLPFVKMAQEAGVKLGPPVFEAADGRRIGWAVMETRTLNFGQPRLGDPIAHFSADVALEEKARTSRRWALDRRTGQLLGIHDIVGICIDLEARRAVPWPDDLRRQIAPQLQPDLA
ncbi:MAG: acyl-ACP thioesterase [Planctomycetota bacterium]